MDENAQDEMTQEDAAREALDAGRLEFPRMLCKADGTQVRVESRQDALDALAGGRLTLLPTAPSPHDGGTPTLPPHALLPRAVQDAIERSVAAALPVAEPVTEDAVTEDVPKKRKR